MLTTEGRGLTLRCRRNETKALDRLLADARKDHSGVVVVRGEAGVGKTALLDYLAERADGFRIARAVGIESEMELPYAGLHQLCAPLLEGLEDLPAPQRDALASEMGVGAFAERARRELAATGESARTRTDDTRDELTAQEAQIARLARDGLSNREIGAELFISPRTVKYHLRKVFTKLGISSRQELLTALPDSARQAVAP
jgi:DNA-binding CsgD family transcriptional regulator